MPALPLNTEQSAVVNACDAPMDLAFGEGVTGPVQPLPPYEKYKDLHITMKALVKNAFKSFLASILAAWENTSPNFISVSYQGGWAAWGDANYSQGLTRYYKDPLGYVHIEGLIRSPTSPVADSTMFTLPAGYRPGTNSARIFPAVMNDLFASIQVGYDGTVVFRSIPQSNTWVSLQIVFKAGG